MKRIILLLAAFFILLLPAYGTADDLGTVRLSLIEGDVQVLIQDTTDWAPATINLPMNEHDRIWVADYGKAELQVRGGVYARADGNTALDILTVKEDSAQVYLDRGHLYINNRPGGINTVQVDTPMASLRSYDDSIMLVDVTEGGMNEISVLKGAVYAESRAGMTKVDAGNTLTLRGENNAELSPISSPDDWERWNMERDRKLTAWTESSRYLPDQLHEYASDFDRHGRWDYEAEYGYVWVPTVVAASWTPYSYGSWIWIRGNYVWVDYAPWGWAPSHYGRWVFLARGWCWVPPAVGAVYWGPGYVGWIFTPGYVAWVPLAPGEIYYGYGYYGPSSVNITTININTVVVNRNYRNARRENSVVVVRRDSFGTGRRVPVRIRENPFQAREDRGQDVAIVPPRVRPERAITLAPEHRQRTRQGAQERDRVQRTTPQGQTGPGTTPDMSRQPRGNERNERTTVTPRDGSSAVTRQQLPPERVRRHRPEEMKNERPIVRQQGASVFGQQPDNLQVRRSNEPRVIERRPVPGSANRGEQGRSRGNRESQRRSR